MTAKANGRAATLAAARTPLDELLAHPTEGGSARWFLHLYRHQVRFVVESGAWYTYNSGRWQRDDANLVHELVKDSGHKLLQLVPHETSEARQKQMVTLAHQNDRIDRIRRVLAYAATDPSVVMRLENCDTDPHLLNTANGSVDLRDGRLLVHRPENHLTKTTGIPFDPNAKAPMFLAFLNRITRAHPELEQFLQVALGYTLLGDSREHKFFLVFGTGRNGKSTLIEVIQYVLGDYAQSSCSETWLRQRGGRGAEPDIARLPGVRMVCTAEIGENRALDEPRIKAIVAGDRTTTRTLYREPFDFEPKCKLWISTNHAPRISGTDEGMWRRVCLVPFDDYIEDSELDRELQIKLRAEAPGILTWLVQGCINYQRDGLAEPEIVRAKTTEYRSDSDIIGQFLDESCNLDSTSRTPASLVYQEYSEWARARGERAPINATMFGRRLTERGIGAEKIGGVQWRVGLRLRPADTDQSRPGTSHE